MGRAKVLLEEDTDRPVVELIPEGALGYAILAIDMVQGLKRASVIYIRYYEGYM